MRFKDIKVGDIVYCGKTVSTGYGRYDNKHFYLPMIVERTTRTQFIVGGCRYKKDTGRLVGGHFTNMAYKLGDKLAENSEKIISDQTVAYKELLDKLKIQRDIKNLIDNMSRVKFIGLDINTMREFKTVCEKFKDKLDGK